MKTVATVAQIHVPTEIIRDTYAVIKDGSFAILLFLAVGAWFGRKYIEGTLETMAEIRESVKTNRIDLNELTEDVDKLTASAQVLADSHKDIDETLKRLEGASKTILEEVRDLKSSIAPKVRR